MAGTMDLSPRDLYVYERTSDGMWDGSVESPTGAFTSVDIEPEYAATYHGHYFVIENEQGFVYVYKAESREERDKWVEQSTLLYSKWLGDDEPASGEVEITSGWADQDADRIFTSVRPIESQGRGRRA